MKKAESTGKNKGMSTIELLIAFAIVLMAIVAVILLSFGNQSIAVDSQTNTEALAKARAFLEETRAENFDDITDCDDSGTDPCPGTEDTFYGREIEIAEETDCFKSIRTTIGWTLGNRDLFVILSTFLTDIEKAQAQGGDCITEPPDTNWDAPDRFASDTFNPGKPTALDVLNRIAYIGSDKNPFLEIADTNGATLNQSSGLFTTYTNGFTLGVAPNSVDVAKWVDPLSEETKYYAYLAMHDNVDQLKVVDVTEKTQPVIKATATLLNVNPLGSYPQGWKVMYYDDRLYVITRETAGAEFHIFDVSTPTNPIELGSGTSIDITVEDMAIKEKSGKKYAYMATDQNLGEIKVYEITDPTNTGTISLEKSISLDGNNDGASIYIVGNKLYFGRQSTGGSDLYIYDISSPTNPAFLGSADIGTGVIGIRVAGPLAFLATPKTNKEFQVWRIEDPSNIFLVKEYNFGNIVSNGVEYEPDFIYTTGQSTPNFQILYDKTP